VEHDKDRSEKASGVVGAGVYTACNVISYDTGVSVAILRVGLSSEH
jgi:hypothetical protein